MRPPARRRSMALKGAELDNRATRLVNYAVARSAWPGTRMWSRERTAGRSAGLSRERLRGSEAVDLMRKLLTLIAESRRLHRLIRLDDCRCLLSKEASTNCTHSVSSVDSHRVLTPRCRSNAQQRALHVPLNKHSLL